MQKLLMGGVFSLLLGITGCQQPATNSSNQSTETTADSVKTETPFVSLSADDFEKIIAHSNIHLVDVRSNDEYIAGHIKGSLNIDLKGGIFVESANKLLPKEDTIAVYCRSGRRSKEAAKILAEEGFKVVELNGGFNEWTESQHEIEK